MLAPRFLVRARAAPRPAGFRSGGAGAQLWGLFGASRSKPRWPRGLINGQGIKTASASRKIGRESSTAGLEPSEGRRRQVPTAIDPVARRQRRAKR